MPLFKAKHEATLCIATRNKCLTSSNKKLVVIYSNSQANLKPGVICARSCDLFSAAVSYRADIGFVGVMGYPSGKGKAGLGHSGRIRVFCNSEAGCIGRKPFSREHI